MNQYHFDWYDDLIKYLIGFNLIQDFNYLQFNLNTNEVRFNCYLVIVNIMVIKNDLINHLIIFNYHSFKSFVDYVIQLINLSY